jgi:hypothetical protein
MKTLRIAFQPLPGGAHEWTPVGIQAADQRPDHRFARVRA